MKNITLITAIGFILSCNGLKANHLNSEFNLKMYDNSAFTVTIDNNCFNELSWDFSLANLTPGKHYLKVMKLGKKKYGYCNVPVIVYNSYINVPAQSKVYAMIDFYGSYKVCNISPVHSKNYYGHDKYTNEKNCHAIKEPVCEYGLPQTKFCELKNTIASKSFDSSKLQIAKQAISTNNLTSVQITELIGLITFESNKLDLAKFAYRFTIDKQNYYMVNNAFAFESSVKELNRYLGYN